MKHLLHSTTATVDGATVPVTVTSWLAPETIGAVVGPVDWERFALEAALDARARWGELLTGTPQRVDVTAYVASADDGGDLRAHADLVVGVNA